MVKTIVYHIKCWDKFDKTKWDLVVDSTSFSVAISSIVASTFASTVHIFEVNYECFLQLQTAQAS